VHPAPERGKRSTVPDAREQKYLDMIAQFPESPLGHFSLARYYVEVGRFQEAIPALERCLKEEPAWAAAMVSLGDALAGAGRAQEAIEVLTRARESALAQSHASLAEDIDERLADLRG